MIAADRRAALAALFAPRAVAIVGASDDARKWGNWLARGALRGEHRRPVHLVNAVRSSVLGRICRPRVSAIPGGVDLAVLAVPARFLPEAVDDALAGGAKALVAISAGLGEVDAEGARLQSVLVDRVRAGGAVLLGPNCLGLYDAAGDLYLTSNDLPPGPVALLSQSGNLALELGELAREAGLGFTRFVSLGNQADLTAADLIGPLAETPHVRAVAVYGEDWRDGRRFLAAAADVVARGIPVVVLSVGEGAAARRAARSHTGALVSDPATVAAACRAVGAHMVRTAGEMVDLLQIVCQPVPVSGRRLAILADGGGHGALAADAAHRAGLLVPRLAAPTTEALADIVAGSTANPVDMAGAGEADVWNFVRATRTLSASDQIDAVLVSGYFGGYGAYGETLAQAELAAAETLGGVAHDSGKPLVVHSLHRGTPALQVLRGAGVPVYARVEQAMAALARAGDREGARGLPRLPASQDPVRAADYFTARNLLAQSGVIFPPAVRVDTPEQALSAARRLGYPVAVKAVFLPHKSDAGGVALGLADQAAVAGAVRDIRQRLGPGPLSVERMVGGEGVELVVGARRDARFGPVVLVGLGGVYVEVLADVVVELAPVDEDVAGTMLRRLRGAGLLLGARGRPRLDVEAAARVVATLSEVLAAHPEVWDIEVNPLKVLDRGAVGLDARMVLTPGAGGES